MIKLQTEDYSPWESQVAHVLLKAKQLAINGIFEMDYHIDEKYQFGEQYVNAIMIILRNRYGMEANLRCFRGKEYWCTISWRSKGVSCSETVFNEGTELYEIAKANKKTEENELAKCSGFSAEDIAIANKALEIEKRTKRKTAKYEEDDDYDDNDDDWLGPNPEETWADLYEKD